MKEKLPFEHALENKLQQITQPDEEASWKAMKQLLEKNNKKPGLVLFNRKLFLFIAIILLSGLALRQFVYIHYRAKYTVINSTELSSKTKDQNNKTSNYVGKNIQKTHEGSQDNFISPGNTINDQPKVSEEQSALLPSQKKNNGMPAVTAGVNSKANDKDKTNLQKNKKHQRQTNRLFETAIIPGELANEDTRATELQQVSHQKQHATPPVKGNNKYKVYDEGKASLQITTGELAITKDVTDNSTATSNDPAHNIPGKIAQQVNDDPEINHQAGNADTPANKKLLTLSEADTSIQQLSASVKPNIKSKSRKFSLLAGIGLSQQIPFGDRKIYLYGFNGRNNIFNDYIPSVYLRFEKTRSCFIILEYNYATPKVIDDLAYSRKSTINNITGQLSVRSTYLKKAFYHSLGISFNYFIRSAWSAGAGVSVNKLYRSISEERVSIKNQPGQQDETSSSIIPLSYTGSFFYKTTGALLLQTNYEWRRLSFGIRWSADLQPYIKYTLPSGKISQSKNQSFNLLIKIRLGRKILL